MFHPICAPILLDWRMVAFYVDTGNSWEDEEQHKGGLNEEDAMKERMHIINLPPYLIYVAAMCCY